MSIVSVAVFILFVSNSVICTPFLYNSPRALTTLAASASASASSPPEPPTHIADLRVKQKKAEQLRAEKQLAEEEDDIALHPEDEDVSNNEAAPSLFQKKVSKILTKLRIISSLTGGKNGGSDNMADNNSTQVEVEEIEENENSTETLPTFQKVIYPQSNYGVPIKLQLNLNEEQAEAGEDRFGEEAEANMGRLGQIGVFFAEMLGSIVALVYGAAAQINNTLQGNTAATVD